MELKAKSAVKKWIGKYQDNLLFNRLFAVLSIDILVKLSGMILLPVYLRLMTQDEFGLYGYLLSIILTFSLVLNFGLYIPLSKFYHDNSDPLQRGKLLFTIFSILGLFIVFAIFPIYFFRWDYEIIRILFKNPINYNNYRGVVLLSIITSICNFMLTNFFFTSEKIGLLKRYNIYRIICINLLTVIALFMLKGKDSVRVRLETTYIIEAALFVIFSYFCFRQMRLLFDRKLAISSLRLALPVMISAVFGIIINFGDKFFLEKYGSFKDLSYYYLAVSCASVIPLVFASFQNAWLPLFLKEKDIQKNVAKTTMFLRRIFLAFVLLSFLILLFVKLLLFSGIIPPKYHETIYILPILLLSQIMSALVPLYSNYLVYFEKTHVVSITGLFLCGASLLLNMYLIPRFGVYGAAMVSLLSNISYLITYYFIVKIYTKKHLLLNYSMIVS